jgi:biotin-(acetyl-CoA carboxylase) ligase
VLIEGKKVAGVLIEMDRGCFIIGVGCNVGVAPTVEKEGKELGRDSGKLLDFVEDKSAPSSSSSSSSSIVRSLADYISSEVHEWADNCEGTGGR